MEHKGTLLLSSAGLLVVGPEQIDTVVTRQFRRRLWRAPEEVDSRSDRNHVAARAKAMDCSIPGATKLDRLKENIGW